MIQSLSRRHLLHLSAFGGAGLLAACTTIHSGGVTTATIDVARVVSDSQAILSTISAALLAPGLIALLGPNYATAQAALVAAQLVLSEIEAFTGSSGTISVSTDTTKIQALVVSLLSDAQTALALVQGVLGKLPGSEAMTAGNAIAAALALIPMVQLAAGLAGTRSVAGPMSEAQALAVAKQLGR
jgi:hypothetical protein